MTLPTMVADVLDAAHDTLATPPTRAYVSHGAPAHDCEQLSVHLGTSRVESSVGRCDFQVVHVVVVTLLRCVPTVDERGVPPTPDALTASAAGLLADGQALLPGLIQLCGLGALFSDPTLDCGRVRWAPGLVPIAPLGGFGGWTLTFEVRP